MMFNEQKDACCLREVLVHCGFEFCPQVLSLGWIWKKRKHFLYFPMSSFSTAFLHSAFQAASPQLLSSENQHRPINAQGRKPTDKKAKQGCEKMWDPQIYYLTRLYACLHFESEHRGAVGKAHLDLERQMYLCT